MKKTCLLFSLLSFFLYTIPQSYGAEKELAVAGMCKLSLAPAQYAKVYRGLPYAGVDTWFVQTSEDYLQEELYAKQERLAREENRYHFEPGENWSQSDDARLYCVGENKEIFLLVGSFRAVGNSIAAVVMWFNPHTQKIERLNSNGRALPSKLYLCPNSMSAAHPNPYAPEGQQAYTIFSQHGGHQREQAEQITELPSGKGCKVIDLTEEMFADFLN